jgi:hypothetical protein
VQITPGRDGTIHLPAHYAEIRAEHGQRAKLVSQGGRAYIGNWSNPNDVVVWQFRVPSAGAYAVQVDARMASQDGLGQRFEINLGEQKLAGKVEPGGMSLAGRLQLAPGEQELSVKLPGAKRTGSPVLDLFGLKLVPARP